MRCLQQSTDIFPLSLRVWKNECEWFMQWWIKLSEFCKSRTSDAIPMSIFTGSFSPHKATHLIHKQHFVSHVYVEMSFWVIQRIQSYAEKRKSTKKPPLVKAIYFNLEQSKWNITKVSVTEGYALLTDAQNTLPYVLINTSIFFLFALMLNSCTPVTNSRSAFSYMFRCLFKSPPSSISSRGPVNNTMQDHLWQYLFQSPCVSWLTSVPVSQKNVFS